MVVAPSACEGVVASLSAFFAHMPISAILLKAGALIEIFTNRLLALLPRAAGVLPGCPAGGITGLKIV